MHKTICFRDKTSKQTGNFMREGKTKTNWDKKIHHNFFPNAQKEKELCGSMSPENNASVLDYNSLKKKKVNFLGDVTTMTSQKPKTTIFWKVYDCLLFIGVHRQLRLKCEQL